MTRGTYFVYNFEQTIMIKPMLKYRGGKWREIPQFIRYVPEFNGRYIEPFFGGGAVFFYLEPKKSIINDINKPLMQFYGELRDNYRHIKSELKAIQAKYDKNRKDFEQLKKASPNLRVEDKNEELYYRLRDMFNKKKPRKFSHAALYYFINKTAYSGMVRYNAQGEYNVPYGRYKNFNTDLIDDRHEALLRGADIHCRDYKEIFAMAGPDDFMFLDPPYDSVFSDYGNIETKDGFTAEMHRELAQDFYALPCKAMMIIGKTDLTKELYGKSICFEYDKSYAVNIRNRFKSESKHIVVLNYNAAGGS